MKANTKEPVLRVDGLEVVIKRKTILKHVTFHAEPGSMLAVLGPSGSGKTTMLNTIAGRQPLSSGDITMGDQPMNKQLRRRLAYVLQSDVFLSNLTLWETLFFSAMIRLPEEMSYADKTSRVNDIIDILELRSCSNTLVGDMFSRGLSGGEKKRMNIACELLMDPDILLLDEPTSGLDSSTALNLMQQIQDYAVVSNKIVVVTIHQPSSQMYMLFESLLLLTSGEVVYFGPGLGVPLAYFSQLGHVCQPNFNPADFFLDVLKSDHGVITQLVAASRSTKGCSPEEARRASSVELSIGLPVNGSGSKPRLSAQWSNGRINSVATIITNSSSSVASWSRWPTGFWTQFRMLTWRNFKQSRGRILNLYDVTHFAVMAAIAGVIFFQIPKSADVFRDRMGLLFFCVTFWTFSPAVDAILAFPAERPVVLKERAAGAYRLSAYYLAKTASELPLYVIAPTAFYSVVYWMAGLGDVTTFFITMAIIQLAVFNAHGLGLLLGATFTNTRLAIIVMNTVILICLLLSGFITQTLPWWFTWARYLSLIQYPLSAISIIVFQDMESISCNSTSVLSIPKCIVSPNDYVTSGDVLHDAGIVLPVLCYLSTMGIIFFVLRIGAYFSLRFLNKVHT